MNREDFPILKKDIIYFDNGATTLKPKVLCDAINDYYMNYSANAHRGDYDMSLKVDEMYAIRWHMGFTEPKELYNTISLAYEKYPLALALHEADLEASKILEANS